VRVIDDFSTGHPDNLAGSKDDIDLVEEASWTQRCRARGRAGASAVFHEAAIRRSPDRSRSAAVERREHHRHASC
jgi:hypothetical protein